MTDRELFIVCTHIVVSMTWEIILWVLFLIAMVILLTSVASGLEYLARKLRR